MSLISIITQTLKSQYPPLAERSNLREHPPPRPVLSQRYVWEEKEMRKGEREREIARERRRRREG